MLTIKLDDNGVFSDFSIDVQNYIFDKVSFDLVVSEDSLYIGYEKPLFGSLYIEMSVPNTNSANMALSYYNGAFTALELTDYTKGLTRSGFITWVKSEDDVKTTIDGKELYWYKLTIDATSTVIDLDGFNIVFASDTDLVSREPQIEKYKDPGMLSFISYHQSARDHIIQRLRNSGKVICDDVGVKDLNQFDLQDIGQLKEASKLLALSHIYFYISDSIDDKYYQKHIDYKKEFNDAFDLYLLSYDKNDDGNKDNCESGIVYSKVVRI